MAMTKPSAFTFLHANQVDALYTVYTATQIKSFFDSQGTELRSYLLTTLTSQIDNELATKAELATAVLSGLSVDSITNSYLATDVKVGSLATLTTTTKSTVVGAINELAPLLTNNGVRWYGKPSRLDSSNGTGTLAALIFSTKVIDSFSNLEVSSPTKLTVPALASKVKISINASGYHTNDGSYLSLSLYKNGVSILTIWDFGYPVADRGNETYIEELYYTASPNDYFQLYGRYTGADGLTVNHFQMDVIA